MRPDLNALFPKGRIGRPTIYLRRGWVFPFGRGGENNRELPPEDVIFPKGVCEY